MYVRYAMPPPAPLARTARSMPRGISESGARLLFKGPRSPGPAVSKRELSHYVATPKRFVGCIASVDPRCCALLSKAAATEGEVHVA